MPKNLRRVLTTRTPASRKIIYLACPYTHPDKEVREKRFRAATAAAADLVAAGHIVYSPITMTHPIDELLAGRGATLGSDYWVAFDEAFMDFCNEIVILEMEGWKESSGIQREVEYFRKQGKPINFKRPMKDVEDSADNTQPILPS